MKPKERVFMDYRGVYLKERIEYCEKWTENDQKVRMFCLLESIASD